MENTTIPASHKGRLAGIIALLVLVVIVAGGLYYFYNRTGSGQPQATQRQVVTVPVTPAPPGKLIDPVLKPFVLESGRITSSGTSTFPIAGANATIYSVHFILNSSVYTIYHAYESYLKEKGYTITGANATDAKAIINANKPYETVMIVGTRVDAMQVGVRVDLTKTN